MKKNLINLRWLIVLLPNLIEKTLFLFNYGGILDNHASKKLPTQKVIDSQSNTKRTRVTTPIQPTKYYFQNISMLIQ